MWWFKLMEIFNHLVDGIPPHFRCTNSDSDSKFVFGIPILLLLLPLATKALRRRYGVSRLIWSCFLIDQHSYYYPLLLLMARSQLEDFEIQTRLGAGSFGTVFKVRRHADDLIYVIKTVRIAELPFKEQNEAINEVKILSQLDNAYVVQYFDSFLQTDSLYIGKKFLLFLFIFLLNVSY